MSNSSILKVPEIAQNQNNKYVTHNDAIAYLEQAMHAKVSKTVSGTTDVTLTENECTRYRHYYITGGTGNHNLVFLGELPTGGSTNAGREFIVENATSYSTTVKSDAAGTTVTLLTGQKALIRQDHDDMTLVFLYTGTTTPYDIGLFLAGQPADGSEVFKFVATRAISFADDFAGSVGHCGTNPTATAAFDILKNGSSIGSISISTSGTFTFNTTGGSVSLAAGDRISVTSPSPQDASLANVAVTFAGTRSLI